MKLFVSSASVFSASQILDEGGFPKQYQWQNRSITQWSTQQVARWLMGLNLEQHILEFTAKNIDGEQLLQLDSTDLKVSYYMYNIYIYSTVCKGCVSNSNHVTDTVSVLAS